MKENSRYWMMALALMILLGSCTADPQQVEACITGEPAGFWLGLWHGFIAPVTFILSLFIDSIDVFEVNNTGGWYIFGFLLGIGAFTKGGSEGAKRAKR